MQTVDLDRLGLGVYRPRRRRVLRVAAWSGFASLGLGTFAGGVIAGRWWIRRA